MVGHKRILARLRDVKTSKSWRKSSALISSCASNVSLTENRQTYGRTALCVCVCVQRYFRHDDFGADRTVACRAVHGQRLGKHFPAATDAHATIEVLLETGFSTQSVPRGYKEDNLANQVNSVRESEEKSHRRIVREAVGNEQPFRQDSNPEGED
jgi:hypothetical protein